MSLLDKFVNVIRQKFLKFLTRTFGDEVARQVRAAIERTGNDACHTVGNLKTFQTVTSPEGILTNACQTIGKRDI